MQVTRISSQLSGKVTKWPFEVFDVFKLVSYKNNLYYIIIIKSKFIYEHQNSVLYWDPVIVESLLYICGL